MARPHLLYRKCSTFPTCPYFDQFSILTASNQCDLANNFIKNNNSHFNSNNLCTPDPNEAGPRALCFVWPLSDISMKRFNHHWTEIPSTPNGQNPSASTHPPHYPHTLAHSHTHTPLCDKPAQSHISHLWRFLCVRAPVLLRCFSLLVAFICSVVVARSQVETRKKRRV